MKIAVSNATPVGELEQFTYLKACGFDGVEFSFSRYFGRNGIFADIDNVTDEQIKEHFERLRLAAEEAGMEIVQTHSQFSGHPRHYDFDIDEIVRREIACIKATHYLGCKLCVIHPIINAARVYDKHVKENFDEAADFYRRLIPTLEEYDVIGCVENMWNCDPVFRNICSTVFSHAQEMVDMCNLLGDRFKICVDIGHGILTQDDPAEMIRIAGDKLGCLHVHDNDGISDLHTFPFMFTHKPYSLACNPLKIDWADVMKALDDVNYRGTFAFEMYMPGPEAIQEAGHRYLATIGRYLASLRTVKY